MSTIARCRDHNLLEKGLDVSVHKVPERRHRLHGTCESSAGHLCGAPGDLDEKTARRNPGTEHGLHPRAALPPDRCHLNHAAFGVNCHDRDDTTVREEHMVERTIGIHHDLPALVADMLKLRHKPLEIAGWQGEQKPIAGPI